MRIGRRHHFDGLAGKRAEPDRSSGRRRPASDGELSRGVHGLHPGRRDDHRERDRLAQHRCRELPIAGIAGRDPGEQAELAECPHVVRERDPSSRARLQRHIHRPWKARRARRSASATVSNQSLVLAIEHPRGRFGKTGVRALGSPAARAQGAGRRRNRARLPDAAHAGDRDVLDQEVLDNESAVPGSARASAARSSIPAYSSSCRSIMHVSGRSDAVFDAE